jgi:hypothetical protein
MVTSVPWQLRSSERVAVTRRPETAPGLSRRGLELVSGDDTAAAPPPAKAAATQRRS